MSKFKRLFVLLLCVTVLSTATMGCGAGPAQFLSDLLNDLADNAEDFADAAEDLDDDLDDADDGDDVDEAFEDFFDAIFGS
mgnify:CR=1 FL=1